MQPKQRPRGTSIATIIAAMLTTCAAATTVEEGALRTDLSFEPVGARISLEDSVALAAYQEAPTAEDLGLDWGEDETVLLFEPNIWVPLFGSGDATALGFTLDLDFDGLDAFAPGGRLELYGYRYGWGIIFDIALLKIDLHDVTATTPGGMTTLVNGDVEQAMIDLAVFWRFIDRKPVGDWRWSADVIAGVRVQSLDVSIDPTTSASYAQDTEWGEPLIGGRLKFMLNGKLALDLRGDVSGFGVGTASDLTWNFAAGCDIGIANWFRVKAGYRVRGMDYPLRSGSGAPSADFIVHGPYVDLSFRF